MLIDNQNLQRFEHKIDEHIVYATYRIDKNILYINFVEAPPSLRGSGAAGRLMEDIVVYARAAGLMIFPICGYAASWLRRHPEHADVQA